MSSLTIVLLGILAFAIVMLVWRLASASRFYAKYQGQRLIECPENHRPAAVSVAASKLAVKALAGAPPLRLQECSRWPEMENCGQDCLSQIEADPEGCLVWNVVNHWYEGKKCALCGKAFAHINWHDHRPGLLDANRQTVQRPEVPAEKLFDYFVTHKPVCWDCHVAEKFRREHSDLITDRHAH